MRNGLRRFAVVFMLICALASTGCVNAFVGGLKGGLQSGLAGVVEALIVQVLLTNRM